jgi:hypothetical protein
MFKIVWLYHNNYIVGGFDFTFLESKCTNIFSITIQIEFE